MPGVFHPGLFFSTKLLIDYISKYDLNDKNAAYLEKLDVRAFGCLMEDLLNQNFETTNSLKDSLIQLKDSCMQEEILKRPSFEMICNYFLQRR